MQKYAIIAGTSKAGTTSIFNYLARHPGISPADLKETRFFLDAEYPLKPELKGFQKPTYDTFFNSDSAGRIRLEATPDYLYSEGTPQRIKNEVEDARLIFILREPISRLTSWYRFGKAMAEIPGNLSFEAYIQAQIGQTGLFPRGMSHPAFLALVHGKYGGYLDRFTSVFGRGRVFIGSFEELKKDTPKFIADICRFLEIDDTALSNVSLEKSNESVTVRHAKLHRSYDLFKQNLRYLMKDLPVSRAIFRGMGKQLDKLYDGVNVTADETVVISAEMKKFLADYYKDEGRLLREKFGVDVRWS